MPVPNTLARVDEDLTAGRVPMARQRLRGLISSYPQDLTLRRRLAEVYRLYGEAPSEPWTVGGVLAGAGCLVGVVAFLAVWVIGVIALFD
ncbi:DUF6584 family protein [Streptomyces sp. NPDC058326]|uniref:DUF6584 family protein n=1 Tax=Streptomyces sp. NPDC058326 TaxID=3346447 RepID=UPI0036E373BF